MSEIVSLKWAEWADKKIKELETRIAEISMLKADKEYAWDLSDRIAFIARANIREVVDAIKKELMKNLTLNKSYHYPEIFKFIQGLGAWEPRELALSELIAEGKVAVTNNGWYKKVKIE